LISVALCFQIAIPADGQDVSKSLAELGIAHTYETQRVSLTKVLSASVPSPVQDSVSPLSGSARFVTWVTGPKSANGQPFYKGADLGANTEHRRPGDRSSTLLLPLGR
jgi:hypothetical protein